MAVVDFNEKAAQRYLKQAIAQFAADPPDTDFQRGYLEALLPFSMRLSIQGRTPPPPLARRDRG